MGLAMDVSDLIIRSNKNLALNLAIDVLHSNDFTERIHLGSEVVYLDRFALRSGYKFNHDVESFTFGIGMNFKIADIAATIDYAFTQATYFKDINRFSLHFAF